MQLLEYGDYECPFCGDAHAIVEEIKQRLGDELLFVFRNLPLINIHPHAEHAAEAAEAAGAQGDFWRMHDRSRVRLKIKTSLGMQPSSASMHPINSGSPPYAPRIREDFKSGVRAGVNGTPTFFINGERYDGAFDLRHFLNALTSQSA